jgi:hypothetical protein
MVLADYVHWAHDPDFSWGQRAEWLPQLQEHALFLLRLLFLALVLSVVCRRADTQPRSNRDWVGLVLPRLFTDTDARPSRRARRTRTGSPRRVRARWVLAMGLAVALLALCSLCVMPHLCACCTHWPTEYLTAAFLPASTLPKHVAGACHWFCTTMQQPTCRPHPTHSPPTCVHHVPHSASHTAAQTCQDQGSHAFSHAAYGADGVPSPQCAHGTIQHVHVPRAQLSEDARLVTTLRMSFMTPVAAELTLDPLRMAEQTRLNLCAMFSAPWVEVVIMPSSTHGQYMRWRLTAYLAGAADSLMTGLASLRAGVGGILLTDPALHTPVLASLPDAHL